jgi:hypothetical protein
MDRRWGIDAGIDLVAKDRNTWGPAAEMSPVLQHLDGEAGQGDGATASG